MGYRLDKLREIRIMQGMSLAELAEKAGVDSSTISGYESGRRKRVSVDVMTSIADALGVSVNVFLHYDASSIQRTAEYLYRIGQTVGLTVRRTEADGNVSAEIFIEDGHIRNEVERGLFCQGVHPDSWQKSTWVEKPVSWLESEQRMNMVSDRYPLMHPWAGLSAAETGQLIRNGMIMAGLNITETAGLVGISDSAFGQIISGKIRLSDEMQYKIETVLNDYSIGAKRYQMRVAADVYPMIDEILRAGFVKIHIGRTGEFLLYAEGKNAEVILARFKKSPVNWYRGEL